MNAAQAHKITAAIGDCVNSQSLHHGVTVICDRLAGMIGTVMTVGTVTERGREIEVEFDWGLGTSHGRTGRVTRRWIKEDDLRVYAHSAREAA